MSTSSADLWIASNYCTSLTGCSSTVPLFNSSLSQTQVDMNTSFSVRYGSGQAQGEMMQDYVAFAGYNVSSQAFALVESVSRDLLGGDISGLMGESPPPVFLSFSFAIPVNRCADHDNPLQASAGNPSRRLRPSRGGKTSTKGTRSPFPALPSRYRGSSTSRTRRRSNQAGLSRSGTSTRPSTAARSTTSPCRVGKRVIGSSRWIRSPSTERTSLRGRVVGRTGRRTWSRSIRGRR